MIKKLEKADGQSMDIVETNIEQLKELFPEVFAEGRINFDRLQEVLGNYVVSDEDHYNFTWHGKRAAGRLAQTPSTGTLRPCQQESVDWDKTQNLFIEGDNLEVLKLLQKSYHRQIKMIYIDPPYNTGNDFVYEDDFKDGVKNYLAVTGQLDDEGKKKGTNSSSAGRYHTNWLNMMYPRLKLARNLLRDDGVAFISIGEEEVANLEKICNEIFGEENLLTICSRVMKTGGQKGTHFSPCVDYILVYAKSIYNLDPIRAPISQNVIDKVYTKIEEHGEKQGKKYRSMGLYQAVLEKRANQRYFIECPDGSLVIPPGSTFPQNENEGQQVAPADGDGVWRWTYSRYAEEKDKGNIEFIQSDRTSLVDPQGQPAKYNVYYKIWLEDRLEDGQLPGNILDKFENRHSSAELKELEIPFDYAKPVNLIKYLAAISGAKDRDIVLDFFAGSCSTAHAMYSYSADLNNTIRFICVQLPEKTHETSDEYKQGYSSISDIGKERIRRAAKKIKEENPLFSGDLGFKVFKLDTSNIKTWEAGFDTLKDDLIAAADYIKQDRSSDDIVFELLLKYGLNLTVPIEIRTIGGKKVYSIGMGALVVCLDNDVPMETVNGIGALKEELKPEIMRVVFKDSGFKDDVVKTNAHQTLKRFGIEDIKSL